jgi:hypothetical protein
MLIILLQTAQIQKCHAYLEDAAYADHLRANSRNFDCSEHLCGWLRCDYADLLVADGKMLIIPIILLQMVKMLKLIVIFLQMAKLPILLTILFQMVKMLIMLIFLFQIVKMLIMLIIMSQMVRC